MKRRHRVAKFGRLSSAFAGFRFAREVILLAVRWYLRFGLSYRDLEELLAERGVAVDHVTLHRWVQRFTPLLIDAARPCRHAVGRRWFVDETYVKVAACGAMRTALSTDTARSSTCTSRFAVTSPRRAGSSRRRSPRMANPKRFSPTGQRRWRMSSKSCCRRRCTTRPSMRTTGSSAITEG